MQTGTHGRNDQRERAPFPWLQAAIQFVVFAFSGLLLTSVVGLFAYANAPDPNPRDAHFMTIFGIGLAVSLTAGLIAAIRVVQADRAETIAPAYNLLKKYRRAVSEPGADAQAGQYKIGEQYLRELLGRRGG